MRSFGQGLTMAPLLSCVVHIFVFEGVYASSPFRGAFSNNHIWQEDYSYGFSFDFGEINEFMSYIREPATSTPGDGFGHYPGCLEAGGWPLFVGDGNCDSQNSIKDCAYDGGDCCSCTCVDTKDFKCAENKYLCLDPSVSTDCVEASASHITLSPPIPEYLNNNEYPKCDRAGGFAGSVGDGCCDFQNTIEECGYDGGDCCSCTCVSTDHVNCGEPNGYHCQDPSVSGKCKEESDSYVPPTSSSSYQHLFSQYPRCFAVGGRPAQIGDGDCDFDNSREECAYDGGDCCSCTCVDTENHTCGEDGGYYCRDPTVSADCMEGSDTFIPGMSSLHVHRLGQHPTCDSVGGDVPGIGDGYCDSYNNNQECAYDGGDCCSCTCEAAESHICGVVGYDCQDPTVSTVCRKESASYRPTSDAR